MNQVFRKSWVSYIKHIIGLLVGLFIMTSPIIFNLILEINFIEDLKNSVEFFKGKKWLIWLLFMTPGLILVLDKIYTIALLRSYKMEISTDFVKYKGGLLPWKKEERFWYYSQIFQAQTIQSPQFFAWLLSFGTIIIVEKQGTTEKDPITSIHRAGKATALINKKLKNFR